MHLGPLLRIQSFILILLALGLTPWVHAANKQTAETKPAAKGKATKAAQRKPSEESSLSSSDTEVPDTAVLPTSPAIVIHPTDPLGNSVIEVGLEKQTIGGFYDLLFRTQVGKPYDDYVSWAFEAHDPQESHTYQMAFEGKLPDVIHWDGLFSDESEIKLNKKYFIRLILVRPDGKLVASSWGPVVTGKKKAYEGPKNRGEYITLYVMPNGGGHFIMLKTATQTVSMFPSVYGDFRLHLFDKYMCGMGFATTANTLFGYQATATGFGYADISGFCRYRAVGQPLRAPIVPLTPSFMGKNFKPNVPDDLYGSPLNVEVGAKLFYTTLRGFPGTPLDAELFRSATGMSATVNIDRAFWLFRAHGGLELGYSVFRGSVLAAGAEFGLTYDRLKDVAPGIQVKYALYKGKPPTDQPNAGASITNNMVFIGVMGYFKL